MVTEKHTYHFKTDSDTNAHEWVRALQKEIFRIRNEGDEVKIRIPLNNILDIENIKVLSIIDALRLRVVDSSETYNISEYVLAFLHGIKSDEHPDQHIPDPVALSTCHHQARHAALILSHVVARLSDHHPQELFLLLEGRCQGG